MLDRVETPLAARVKARIRASGPITFRDFMDAALYDPEGGFYARGPEIGTPEAAFSTSARFEAFAFAMARAVREAERRAGAPLRVVELGGGAGDLARGILRFAGPREYVTVDPSAGLRAKQAAVPGVRALASLGELEPAPTVLLANEVLDALPVHRVAGDGRGGILEVVVGLDARGEFVERLAPPSTPALAERLRAEGVSLGRGQVGEVCLDLDALVADAARVVSRGYLAFVDYGDDAEKLYAPTRLNGTLKAYREQSSVHDAYDRVGEQDLTADVDLTALAAAARRAGLEDAGRATQGPWLVSMGVADYVDVADDADEAKGQVLKLTEPIMLGTAFEVVWFRTPGLADAPGFVA